MKKNKFYITTTLAYINASPHIGYARELIEADALARWYRTRGDEVFFNTGTDEHGLKIFRKSKELGMEAQKYCDEKVLEFDKLKKELNLSYNNFIRTTDEKHIKAVQEFWKICDKNGYIYKKNYKVKYCVGCELEKTDSELENGECPLHPGKRVEIIEEKNYFFRYSSFEKKLLEFYEKNPDFIFPKHRFNEIKSFVSGGLRDFSISRIKEKMPWGIAVPNDESQVIYVWFDALANYISAIGWPEEKDNFKKWWPAIQFCGKDNLRPQAAMWQAMLMATNLPASKKIFVNGFITANGQKMSKSLGNVISPYEMTKKFGIDGTRYLLLSFGNFGEDSDLNWDGMQEKYNADLANGLGNLVSRVIKLAEDINFIPKNDFPKSKNSMVEKLIEKMELGQALEHIWKKISEANKYIDDNKPWNLKKENQEKFEKVMKKLLEDLNLISQWLAPFLPETSEKIIQSLRTKKMKEVLFLRMK